MQRNANLVDLEKMMLKNASFLAILAVHTAENEPSRSLAASQPLSCPLSRVDETAAFAEAVDVGLVHLRAGEVALQANLVEAPADLIAKFFGSQ